MKLFDNIAPIYGLFFKFQTKYFKEIYKKQNILDFSNYNTVLDIGCGTGALAKFLYDEGLEVTGVDPSIGMLNQARKKLKDTNIKLMHINPEEELPFEDKSFDIVLTSYVAHGISKTERINLYQEMKRLSKKIVLIHDYNEKRALKTTIIEWLENGDYFNFIKDVKKEMEEVFEYIEVQNVDIRAAWYICYCDR